MERKEFIKKCSFACLGLMGLSAIAESCTAGRSLAGKIDDQKLLTVPLSSFINARNNGKYKDYIIIRNEELNYPIVVYRISEKEYTALLLRCSHQQNELTVSGELLSCPAHGSTFNTNGDIVNGPAEMKLRQFPTKTDAQSLYIDLA